MKYYAILSIAAILLLKTAIASPKQAGRSGTCCNDSDWVYDDEATWVQSEPATADTPITSPVPSFTIGSYSISVTPNASSGSKKSFTKYSHVLCCDADGRKTLSQLTGAVTLDLGTLKGEFKPTPPSVNSPKLTSAIKPSPFSVAATASYQSATLNGSATEECTSTAIDNEPVTVPGELALSGGISSQLGKVDLAPDSYIPVASEVAQVIDFVTNRIINGINTITAIAVSIEAKVSIVAPVSFDAKATPTISDIDYTTYNYSSLTSVLLVMEYKVSFASGLFEDEAYTVIA